MRRFALVIALIAALAPGARADDVDRNDPIEPINRGVFWFNDRVDVWLLEPAARGWDWLVPDRAQLAVEDFFANLRFPVVALNDLLQGKFRAAGVDVARFVINTTVGGLGLADAAAHFGLERHDEDFGQTLGWWGVPAGPYLVLPIAGPSGLRDGPAMLVDAYTAVYPMYLPLVATSSAWGLRAINGRSRVLDQVSEIKEASVDYYVAVRNGYVQRRKVQVNDGTDMSPEEQEDLYGVVENGR